MFFVFAIFLGWYLLTSIDDAMLFVLFNAGVF